jgi:DNA-binding beta-propeller fold protein YncE
MSLPRCGVALIVIALLVAAPAPAAEPASFELVGTIALKGKAGGLDHLALDTKRDRLLVANKINNTFDVVDLKAGKLLKPIPGQGGVQGIAYAADLDKYFVGLGSGGYCNVFDAESLKLVKTVKFKDDADNVRYNPKTQLAYVAHAENELTAIEGKTYKVKATVKLPGTAEGFQLETARPRLYVCIPTPSQVAVIDTDKNEIINNYPIKAASNGHPLILDEANHRIFVGCRKEPMVVVLDSETGKEVATIPIPGGVDDLSYDAKRKRIYASCGDGYLAVIRQQSADKYELAEKVETAKGAKTSLFVPETGRLYLAVPRQEGKDGPEIRIYKVRD